MKLNAVITKKRRLRVSGNKWLGTVLFASVLTGCATSLDAYKAPVIPVPASYQHAKPEGEAASGAVAESQKPVQPGKSSVPPVIPPENAPVEWWHHFGNRELGGLIDRGLSNNADIRIALNRILQAKARSDQAGAGRLPTLTAPLVAADQYPGGTTVGSAPAGASGGSSGGETVAQKTYQASIRADWRLDIWGEQSALADSAKFQLQRAVFERENVQRNLAASIASSYVEYLSLNDRLKIAKKTEELLGATLSTIEKRVEAGDASLSELEQQRASIFSVRASVPTMEQQRIDAIGAMALLVGTVPGDLKLSDDGLESLALPRAVPGLPSALLLRRPDIRMAEAQLMAANADLAVARARLLPAIDLSAQYGYSSILLASLFSPQALFWNAVGSSTVSIFDAGRKNNDKAFSQALQEEMVESYVRSLHQAMKEVEGALSSVRLADRRLQAQQETIQAARRAWDISTKVYGAGGIDYLTLLDSERSYHRYLDDYQRTRMEYFRSYITLFQALGGGVKPDTGQPTAAVETTGVATSGLQARSVRSFEGIPLNEEGGPKIFWQVELAGLYHRASVGPAWRDLRSRYPGYMEGHTVRPRLKGRIEEGVDEQQSWYRLDVVKFKSPEEADQFCRALKADQQRCRVVSSDSDETVIASAVTMDSPAGRDGGAKAVEGTDPKAPHADVPAPPPAPSPVSPPVATDAAVATPAPVVPLVSATQNAVVAPAPASASASAATSAAAAAPASVPIQAPAPATLVPVSSLAVSAATGQPAQASASAKTAQTSAWATPAAAGGPPAFLASTRVPERKARAPRVTARSYALQVGAFSSMENAKASSESWRGKGYDAKPEEIQDEHGRRWYAVRTGGFSRKQDASVAAAKFRRKEGAPALVAVVQADNPPVIVASAADAAGRSAPELGKATMNMPARRAFTVQLRSYAGEPNADRAAAILQLKGVPAYVASIRDRRKRIRYEVRAGSFPRRLDGLALIRSLEAQERGAARVILASAMALREAPDRVGGR